MAEFGTMGGSFAPLRNVASLLELIERTRARAEGLPGMACFYGPSGFGKSTAATHAEIEFNALRVQMQSTWGKKKLVETMARELSLKPARTVADIVEQICDVLIRQDKPVIIDEADYLVSHKMIEIARDIFENSHVPVILIGEELLPQKLMQWERVHGRILDWVGAQPACAQDVILLAKVYAPGVEIGDALKASLLKASEGSIRRVSTNLAKIREQAKMRGLNAVDQVDLAEGKFQPVHAPDPRDPHLLRSVA